MNLELVPAAESLPAMKETGVTLASGIVLSHALFDGGLKMDRVLTRRLLKQLDKLADAGPVTPGLVSMRAQLRGVLARKGWKFYFLSAHSPDQLRRFGPTLGGLQ
jgi:hypothetical protein